MYGYIFKVVNLNNQKVYISKRKSNTFDSNFFGSGINIQKALKSDGKDCFKVELICWCNTKEDLLNKEKEYIDLFDSRNPERGYNLKSGNYERTEQYRNMKARKNLSLQINQDLYYELLDLASEYGCGITSVIRMIVEDYLNRYKRNDSINRKENL